MTQKAMRELFDVNTPAINKHLKNIFDEEELLPDSTVSKMEIVQNEGGREVTRILDFFSLDAIIAVGYRVNSKKAGNIYEQFCIKQDRDYISEFDRDMVKYLKGSGKENKKKHLTKCR